MYLRVMAEIQDASSPPRRNEHLQGHLGHLTANEQSAFDDFKKQCEREGLLRSDNTNHEGDLKEGIYDDGTLSWVL